MDDGRSTLQEGVTLKGPYIEPPLLMNLHNVTFGADVSLHVFCNLYNCSIGDGCNIGAYVEIGTGVVIGKRCKIGAYTFIPPGITIEDDCFIGPRTTFTNDKYPKAHGDWTKLDTLVKKGASIGAGCVILPGITIGENALIGAGSVVVRDVPADATYYTTVARS